MKRSKKNPRKPSREKKSTTPSNGKQVEKPNKVKNVSSEEKMLHGQQTKDHSLQSNAIDVICKSMDYVKIKVFSESNATSVLPEKKSSVILPRFSVSSLTTEECFYDIDVDHNVSQEKCQDTLSDTICNRNSNAKQLLNARCLKVILHKWYESGANAGPAKAVEVSFCSSLNGLPIHQAKESDSEPVTHSNSKGKTSNSVIPILEKLVTEPATEAAKNLVPASKIDETDASKSTKEDCAALATPVNKPVRDRNTALSGREVFGGDDSSHTFEDDETMLLDALYKSSVENSQRKRICSGSKENIQCKRIKTSDEIKQNTCAVSEKEGKILEKIRLMIHERMEVLNSEFFDHKLEGLSGRVEQAQCLKKHEELALTFLKKVAKLERRINAVITFQKKVLSKKTWLPSADSQNTVLNRLGSSASFPHTINMQEIFSSKLLLPSHTGFTSACVSADASSNEVLRISGEGENLATTNNSDIPNNQMYAQAAMSAPAQSEITEGKFEVIDLTEKEKQNSSKRTLLSINKMDYFTQLYKEQTFLSMIGTDQDPKQFPPLPLLLRIPLYPGLAEEFRDTLPPQKPELKGDCTVMDH